MPGKSREIGFGIVVAEIIEEKEGIELVGRPESEGAPQVNTCSLDGRPGEADPFHWS
jgi:hypothetical protein